MSPRDLRPLEGSSGQQLPSVRFHIAGMPIIAHLLVSEDIHEFLLGYDWLEEQGAHWNFDRKVLILHGKEIPLQTRTSRPSVSRVLARKRRSRTLWLLEKKWVKLTWPI